MKYILLTWLQIPMKSEPAENILLETTRKTECKGTCISMVQTLILIALEIGFFIMFLLLLAKQHSPSVSFQQLLYNGDLFFSPSVYTCDIQKTFSEEERRMYYDREKVIFRKSPAGLRVKAQLACEQSDALCTIDRSSEKSLTVLCITLFSCLGIVALTFDLVHCVTKSVFLCRKIITRKE